MTSFDLDMNFGGITLRFDQEILARTLDTRMIFLHSAEVNDENTTTFHFFYQTSTNLWSLGNTSEVQYFMHRDDFARLVTVSPRFVTGSDDTFLSMTADAALSSFGYPSEPISSNASLGVSTFTADTKSPYVRSFGLDMDAGLLSIEFTEPMDSKSFSFEGLAFQDRANGLKSDKYVPLVETPWSCNATFDYGRVFICDLGPENLNAVKNVNHLCTYNTTTYLSAYLPFASDMAGNEVSIEGFDRIFGLMTSNYTADWTSPVLDFWAVDLNLGTITLFFSESIFMPLFNYSGVIVCNKPKLAESTSIMRIHDPIISSYQNTPKITIKLNDDQFNHLKFSEDLATGDGSTDTFLELEPFLARDTSAQQNLYLGTIASNDNGTMVISNMTQDLHDPELEGASFDMTAETLTLYWNEVVSIASIDLTEFVIQSGKEILVSSETMTIPNISDLITVQDSKSVVFSLSNIFPEIKTKNFLCKSLDSSYVAFTYRFLDDQSGNNVVAIPSSRARRAISYIPDRNAPYLISWSLDLDSVVMILSFSEPIEVESFRVDGLVLSDLVDSSSGADTVKLSKSSNVAKRILNDLYIDLSYEDVNAIKSARSICKEVNYCFLSFTSAGSELLGYDVTTYDMLGVSIQNAIEYVEFIGVSPSILVDDVSPPILLTFDIDLDEGCLYLTFSEPIQTHAMSINATGISLYNNHTDPSNPFLKLSSETFSEKADTDASFVKLILTRQDFYTIKKEGKFGPSTSDATLWLSLANFTFWDSAGNHIDTRIIGTAAGDRYYSSSDGISFLAPANYFADNVGPAIVGSRTSVAGADTNITIYFNDVVLIDTLTYANIFLASFEAIRSVSLGGALLHPALGNKSSELTFSTFPIASSITSTVTILSSQYHSYVYLSGTSVVMDSYGNWNSPMQKLSAVRVGGAIVHFRLDMSSRILSIESVFPLSFSLENINAPQIRLVNVLKNDEFIFSEFTGLETSGDGYFNSLTLSAGDVALIQAEQLITTRSDLRLEVDAKAILDSVNLLELNASTVVRCSQLVNDLSPPTITFVELHLGRGMLTIAFSEHIVVSSIDITKLLFTDGAMNANRTIALENAALSADTIAQDTADTIVIDLNSGGVVPTDRDRIHLSGSVGRSLSETFLVVMSGFVFDTRYDNPNYLEPLTADNARPVDTLVPDLIPPKLVSYMVDFTLREIRFFFDEAVNPLSMNPAEFVFLPSPATPDTDLFSLSDLSVVSQKTLRKNATHTVIVKMNESDVDAIMLRYPTVLSSLENTYLSFPTGAIRDIGYSSNSIKEVFRIYALPPAKFVSDDVPPNLLWFDLSIHTRLVHFWFDEMINCFMTDISKISFQYREFTGTVDKIYSLDPNSTKLLDCQVDNYIGRGIWIRLGHKDILNIKLIPSLMKSSDTTNLLLNRGAFVDVTGNDIEPLRDAHTLLVREYEGDFTRPRLTAFTINRQGLMFLKFNEPILLSSFNFHVVKFTDNRTDAPYQLALTNPPSSLVEVNSNQDLFTLYILPQYQWILDTTHMFDRQDTVYITFSSDFAADSFNNPVYGNTNLTATNIGPGIDGWDLNMDTHEIFIFFSEKMVENFTISSVKLQNAAENPTEVLQLSGTSQGLQFYDHRPFHDEGTAFSAKLSNDDVDRLKLSSLLSEQSAQPLYLWAPLGLATSSSTSTALPNMNSTLTISAIPISDYFPDVTGPVITKVALDLDAGQLKIQFDEPVLGSSLDITRVSLLSDAFGNSIALTGLEDVISVNTSMVAVNLTMADLNSVKFSYSYGSLDKMRCYIDFISDVFGNNMLGDSSLGYSEFIVSIDEFIPDTTPPELLAFSIDLSTNKINIEFDEMVEHWSINPTHIHLLSSSNLSDPDIDFLPLSNYSVLIGDAHSRQSNITVDLGLLRADAFRLQSEGNIGKNISTTFLHISGVVDISGNERHSNTSILRASEIRSDVSSPELESFDFDLGVTAATITFYFSELVDISSFDCADFQFANQQAETPTEIVTLNTVDCIVSTTIDSRAVSFTVSSSKFSGTVIGSDQSSTFAFAPTPSGSADPSGNMLNSLDAHDAKMVGAQIVGFILNVDGDYNGTLDLIFSKDVDRASFNGNKIGWYSPATLEQFFLEGSVQSSGYQESSPTVDFIISVEISLHNLIRLKNIDIADGNMLLLVNASCASDIDGVEVAIARPHDDKTVSKFVRDFTRPRIRSLTIDLATNTIIMDLNEPIGTTTLRIDKLTLQSGMGLLSDSSVFFYKFTGGNFIAEFGDESILYTFVLNSDDFSAIKLMAPNLASGLANTFLSIDFSAFADMSGNMYPTVEPENALQFDHYIEDNLDPVVEHFILDMDNGILHIVCSEPMRADRVNVSEITLQSRYFGGPDYGDNLQYKLNAGSSTVISENSSTIIVKLGFNDLYNIRNTPNLARKQISTYMTLSSDAATDMAGNKVVEIIDGEAYRAYMYIPDSTNPAVEQIVVDFSSDTIAFHFSETVWTKKANVRALRIQSDPANDLMLYHDFQEVSNTLTNAHEEFSTHISFQIGMADLNAIKWRTPLGTSLGTTYFAWSGNLVTDVFSNPTVPTTNLSATIATTFIPDRNPPLLLSYHLNMNTLLIHLEFSESIYLPLTHLEQGILQRTFVKRFGNHVNLSYSVASSGSDVDSNLFDVTIDNRTSHIMKYYGIAISQATSFFTYGSEFVADGFRNFISPLWDGSVEGKCLCDVVICHLFLWIAFRVLSGE